MLHCSLLTVLLIFLKKIKNTTENPGNQIIQYIQVVPEDSPSINRVFNTSALLVDKSSQQKVLLDFSTNKLNNLTQTQNVDYLSTDYKSNWIHETKTLDTVTFDGANLIFTSWQANFVPITDK